MEKIYDSEYVEWLENTLQKVVNMLRNSMGKEDISIMEDEENV